MPRLDTRPGLIGLLVAIIAGFVLFSGFGAVPNASADGTGNPAADPQCELAGNLSDPGDGPFTIEPDEGFAIDFICIKGGAGIDAHPVQTGESVVGLCYSVTFNEDGSVTIARTGDGPLCPDISHVDYSQVASEDPQELLTVSKTVVTSYDRVHGWDIDKGVVTENGAIHNELPKIWLSTDGSGDETATWQIAVTYLGAEDSNHNVSGVITIENEGDENATITSIVDQLAGTSIDVDCGAAVIPGHVLAVGETLECTYSEDVEGKIEGTNVVTVTTRSGGEYGDVKPIRWGNPTNELYAMVAVIDNSDLLGVRNLGTFTAPNGGRITYTHDFAWEDYGQEGCGDFQYDNTATVVGTDSTGRVRLASDDATLLVNVQCFLDETAWADGERYTTRGNWATYVEYAAGECVTLFAGQTIDVGEVCFSAVSGGEVTITVTLTGGNVFADVGDNLKVQGYDTAPSGNPSPGQFANKKTCDTALQTCAIPVPAANFYGVHVDTLVPDPDFGP